jgi:CheY-like chemotaxis protein
VTDFNFLPLQDELVPSILIVDEDADARLLYRTVLENVAASVVEAEDGAEALGKAICRRPDVIVTDTHLPRIDGYTLCSLLRRDSVTQGAAIIVITGAAFPKELARAHSIGADEVLVKPCLPDEIATATYRSWRRRHAASRLRGAEA